MASTSETGHAKNLANFEEVISAALSYGTDYNPSKETLKVSSMQSKAASAKSSLEGVNIALSAYKKAVAERDTGFRSLSKLVTRALNALKASSTTERMDEMARSIVLKIRGTRVSAKLTDEEKKSIAETGKEPVERSSSQMSYDSRLENLDKLVKLLSGIPEYTPNETELKVEAIKAVHNDLKAKNSAVLTTTARLTSARILRDEELYKPLSGLVDTAMDVKTYIKSVFGPSSSQYKQVSKIEFVSRALNLN